MQNETYTITVEETGEQFPCYRDEFLISAMIRSHKGPVNHGCCGGGCGVCKMRIARGGYSVAKKMSRAHISEAEQKDGIVLICCIQPRTDMRLSGVKR